MARGDSFFRTGGAAAWGTVLVIPALLALGAFLYWDGERTHFRLEVTRAAYKDNLAMLENIRREVGVSRDTLERVKALDGDSTQSDRPFIVISVAEHRLWLKKGSDVLFTTRVATGTGKNLETGKGGQRWKFETPRGRLVVERKDVEPAWVPPDWHFVEVAKKKGLRIARLEGSKTIPAGNGAVIAVTKSGANVVTRYPDGREVPIEVREGQEIIVGKTLVIPPYEANQRKYYGTLGSNRLYLGDGYGIHGTDAPNSIGHDASHGCVRVRNEDAELLYRLVPLGTVVYIY
jgi:hypothetical protein